MHFFKLSLLIPILLCAAAGTTLAQAPPVDWDITLGGNDRDKISSSIQTSDGGYLIVGDTYSNESGNKKENAQHRDYWIVKLDKTGKKIEWQRTLGGAGEEILSYHPEFHLSSVIETSDHNFILAGDSDSDRSDTKTEDNSGRKDIWVVMLDGQGNKKWDITLGGEKDDNFRHLIETRDKGFLISGYSGSKAARYKKENSVNGTADYWIIKLSHDGVYEWDRTLGGNAKDILHSAIQTTDGGFLVAGTSESGTSGKKTEASRGGSDYWLVKLDESGEKIEWQRTLGGSKAEELYSVRETRDRGFLLAGISASDNTGEKKNDSWGGNDIWLLKLNSTGESIEWQETLGGNGEDIPWSVIETADEGYLVTAKSNSGKSGNKSENSRGDYDYWVVKLTRGGAIAWDNTLGGSGTEFPIDASIETADGGFLVAGESNSNKSGDKSQNSRGGYNFWVVKLDKSGKKTEWDKTVGANNTFQPQRTHLYSVVQTSDKGLLLAGWMDAPKSGEKTTDSYGGHDYWLVKLQAKSAFLWVEKGADGSEDTNPGNFKIRTNTHLNTDLTISYTVKGSAEAGKDYTALTGSVVLPAGQTSADVVVAVLKDEVVEGTETVELSLSGVGDSEEVTIDAARAVASMNITDNDSAVLSVEKEKDAAEPDQHSTFVIRSTHELNSDLTISFGLAGTADKGADYKTTLPKDEVVLKKGQKLVVVPVEVIDDLDDEEDETVVLTLNKPTADKVTLDPDQARQKASLMIVDNDEKPEDALLSVAKGKDAAEPNNQGHFIISSTETLDEDLIISFTLGGNADEGKDYETVGEKVTLKKGEKTVQVPVKVKDDTWVEGNESVILTLIAPTKEGVLLDEARNSALVYIVDNESAVLSVEKKSDAAEPGQNGSFLISSTNALNEDLIIKFTLSGTAIVKDDYKPLELQAILEAGKITAEVFIEVVNDEVPEKVEWVHLHLQTPDKEGVVLDPSNRIATVQIFDDDKKPAVVLSVVKGKDAAEPTTNGYFIISSTVAPEADLIVRFALEGTAIAEDYSTTLTKDEVVLKKGQTTVQVPVEVVNDEEVEEEETVILTIQAPTLANVELEEAKKSATLRIFDDDVCFELAHQVQAASCSGKADGSITITLKGASAEVEYAWSNNSSGKDLLNVQAGSYTLVVKDHKKGCEVTRKIEIEAQDTTTPIVKAKGLNLQLDGNGKASLKAQDLDDGSTDNCGIKSLTADKTSFSCADVGQNTVTLTVEDGSGNIATASVDVLIEDKQAPALTADQQFSVAEDEPIGTIVGPVKATDNCGIKEWKITAGNAADRFRVDADGNILTNALLDYEDQPLYRLTVEVSDGTSIASTEVVIALKKVCESGLKVKNPIAEAQQVLEDKEYSFVVPLDAFVSDCGEELRYSVVDQPVWFTFDAATRHCGGTPLNEHVGLHQITIKVTDSKGRTAEQHYNLEVINTNDAPHALNLSADFLLENQPKGTLVGELNNEDVDAGDSHTYSLVAGEGDTHNHYFTVENNKLISLQAVDYETEPVLYVRLAVTDKAGATYEKKFIIEVEDVDDGPAFLPNLFSPNGDQVNDSFLLHTRKLGAMQLRIYNLNGRLVFTTNNFEEATTRGWDGRANGEAQPEGSYLWVLDAHYPDGSPVLIDGKTTGNVTLVR
jgi:gliding motility-associated-like protein